jgi:hypothetical protein
LSFAVRVVTIFFTIFAPLKQQAMKHGAIKNIVVAGCKKSPVTVFAPVCLGIDINFM